MAKSKTLYFCTECGNESSKWMGKCPSCNSWNTFREEIVVKNQNEKVAEVSFTSEKSRPIPLNEIVGGEETRWPVQDMELNRVLGGGLVPGSVVLLGGEPGIGKSTLMLQLAVAPHFSQVMYISGEESASQVKMRADRMKLKGNNCLFYSETATEKIFKELKSNQPNLVIIDSVQTLYSPYVDATPGSVSQIRQVAAELIRYAKETSTPVILVGHITKDGSIAGPKVLEHMVDTVLQFEGDRHFSYRILRTIKNRFGSTAELGIYEMQGLGLKEVSNPSQVLINNKGGDLSGVAIAAMIEGNRPFLLETQSLVSPATYGTPQRSSTGFDNKRLNMLLAVLERRCGFKLGIQDVYLNMAGGLKVADPAVDLAICIGLISSLEDIPVAQKACFAAEVGLGGELRPVSRIENRIIEAEKMGFDTLYIASGSSVPKSANRKISIVESPRLNDVIQSVFG